MRYESQGSKVKLLSFEAELEEGLSAGELAKLKSELGGVRLELLFYLAELAEQEWPGVGAELAEQARLLAKVKGRLGLE